jgi:hypothetical protein
VLNFQQEMMYEVRGPAGKNQVLAVGASSSIAEEGAGGDGGDAGGGGRGRGASSRGGSTFPENEWIHVSLVHQADGTASIFWNGTCKASGKVWLPQRVKRAKYYVGRSHWRHDPYFSGCISDVHIFDYALSSSDVLRCAHSRTFPTGFHGRPILSLADSWRLVAETRSPARGAATSAAAAASSGAAAPTPLARRCASRRVPPGGKSCCIPRPTATRKSRAATATPPTTTTTAASAVAVVARWM